MQKTPVQFRNQVKMNRVVDIQGYPCGAAYKYNA